MELLVKLRREREIPLLINSLGYNRFFEQSVEPLVDRIAAFPQSSFAKQLQDGRLERVCVDYHTSLVLGLGYMHVLRRNPKASQVDLLYRAVCEQFQTDLESINNLFGLTELHLPPFFTTLLDRCDKREHFWRELTKLREEFGEIRELNQASLKEQASTQNISQMIDLSDIIKMCGKLS